MLQRVETNPAVYHVVRRSGEVVEVPAESIVTLKLMPAVRGPVTRTPKTWEESAE